MKTPRVHHAARRRGGGVAARGAGAAAGRMRRIGVLMHCSPDDPESRPASRHFCKDCSNWAGLSVATCGSTTAGRRRCRPFANTQRNWSRSRRMSSWPVAADHGAAAAGDPHRADRVRDRRRSGRRRLCREPGAAGRQCHRLHHVRIRLSGKWLELLKQIAPGVTRAAVIRESGRSSGSASSAQSSRWRRRSGWS